MKTQPTAPVCIALEQYAWSQQRLVRATRTSYWYVIMVYRPAASYFVQLSARYQARIDENELYLDLGLLYVFRRFSPAHAIHARRTSDGSRLIS